MEETAKEKENRIFNHYKMILEKDANTNGEIRFIVIEYMCKISHINPYLMAKRLLLDGYVIIFDDTSISMVDNVAKRKRVYS